MVRLQAASAALFALGAVDGFIPLAPMTASHGLAALPRAALAPLRAVPLELEGQLNPANSWEVELELDGVTKKITVSEDTSILEAAEAAFGDPPFSCRNGVCTTCSGLIKEGRGSFILAVNGLGEPQRDAGFTLTCQTYPTGPGLKILLNQYDVVYEDQYGQYESGATSGSKKLLGLIG